jgi:hypothetical protein
VSVWLSITVLSITVIAGAQAISQWICVAGPIWLERERTRSACQQMAAAASTETVLCERHRDGSSRLIVPGTAAREQALTAEVVADMLAERSAL